MEKDIFGAAIKAYYQSKKEVEIKVLSNDFDEDIIPVPYLFRSYADMPKIEQIALSLSKGKVLDVGCGAGCHSLYLQNSKNLKVTAIDTSQGAIEIVKAQGLKNAFHQNFYDCNEKFDTILLLMNGTGIIGKLDNFEVFFNQLKQLLNEGGQVLIDSSDLIYLYENEDGEFWVDINEGYYGEMQYQLSYNNETSDTFDWLYLDYNTLESAAHINGFACEVIHTGDHYNYLAKLSLL